MSQKNKCREISTILKKSLYCSTAVKKNMIVNYDVYRVSSQPPESTKVGLTIGYAIVFIQKMPAIYHKNE